MKCLALQWILAPLATYAFALWASSVLARPSSDNKAHHTEPVLRPSDSSKDAVAAWRHSQSETDPIKRLSKSWEACQEMTIDQFSRAFQEAIADGQTDSVLSLGEAWAMKDAPSLLDQLQETTPAHSHALTTAAYQHWATKDATAAFEHARTSEHPNWTLSTDLAIAFISQNPARLEEAAPYLSNSRYGLSHSYSKSLFNGDVTALAQSLKDSPAEVQSSHTLISLGRAIAGKQPTKASNKRFWEWWQALPPHLQSIALPKLNQSWPYAGLSRNLKAPPEARNQLAELAQSDVEYVGHYMQSYGAQWSKEAPEDALAWILERYRDVDLPGARTHMYGSIVSMGGGGQAQAFVEALRGPIQAMTARDPAVAIDALADIPHLQARSDMASEIVQTWASSEPEKALQWAQTLPAEQLRDRASRAGLTAWAKHDLQGATAYSIRQDTGSDQHLSTVASQASSNGPMQGAAWLASLPSEKIEPVLGHFISRPPQQDRLLPFRTALERLPASEGKQEVLSLINEWTAPNEED